MHRTHSQRVGRRGSFSTWCRKPCKAAQLLHLTRNGLWKAPKPVQGLAKVTIAGSRGFLIVLHSPKAVSETGLFMCPPEKNRDSTRLRCRAARSLQSGLLKKNREIRALFGYFGADRAEILCSSDCVAEEERFELLVRFCRAKARRVRKLQIAKPYQRISPETRHQNWAISPVSIRHLFVRERRMQGDSVAKMVTS